MTETERAGATPLTDPDSGIAPDNVELVGSADAEADRTLATGDLDALDDLDATGDSAGQPVGSADAVEDARAAGAKGDVVEP